MKKTRLHQIGFILFIIGLLITGCGPSVEKQADTSQSNPSSTPVPTTAFTDTPRPFSTPTYTPTPEPQIVLLRGSEGCKREHDIIANSPIQLHYGVWGSLGKAYAEGAWDLLEVTLTMDGVEIEGEKQLVAADLIEECGSDIEDSYWIFYIANLDGIAPGAHYLEVTYYANNVIEDGFGKNHGPGTILTHSYFFESATED